MQSDIYRVGPGKHFCTSGDLAFIQCNIKILKAIKDVFAVLVTIILMRNLL